MAHQPRPPRFTVTKVITWSSTGDPRRSLLGVRLIALAAALVGAALAALGFGYAFGQGPRSLPGSLAFTAAVVVLAAGLFAAAIFRLTFSSRSGPGER